MTRHYSRPWKKATPTSAYVRTVILPNPFADWVAEKSVDLIALAVASGIRTYKLWSMRAGVAEPSLAQAFAIEKATGGEFHVHRWAAHPVVKSQLDTHVANAGVPMAKWVEGRASIARMLYLDESSKTRMLQVLDELAKIRAEEASK